MCGGNACPKEMAGFFNSCRLFCCLFVFSNNNSFWLCVCCSVWRRKPSCPCRTLLCCRLSSTGVATLRYVGLCAENPQLSSWVMPAFHALPAARKCASQSLTFLLHPVLHSGKTGCKAPTYSRRELPVLAHSTEQVTLVVSTSG